MNILMMSLRMFVRDWRARELVILYSAVIVAVGVVTAVSFFTDRIRLALEEQANQLLGADLVVSSDHPIDTNDRFGTDNLEQARSIEFPSMVFTDNDSSLAAIKAVSQSYPLRGSFRISQKMYAPDKEVIQLPQPGSVWIESRLASRLNLDAGDELALGDATFIISAIINTEPGRVGGSVFNLAPRLLLNLHDLGSTQLVEVNSRVRYKYFFSGTNEDIRTSSSYINRQLRAGERMESVEESSPAIRTALERGRHFLGLSALLSVLFAGVAIVVSARRFAVRHMDHCAIMRCFGARYSQILLVFIYELCWISIISGLAGCFLGFIAQYGLVQLMGDLIDVELPHSSARPLVVGMLVSMILLSGFVIPPLLHLKNIPAISVFRRDLLKMPLSGKLSNLSFLVAVAILVIWLAGDVGLGGYVFSGLFLGILILAGICMILFQYLPGIARNFNFGMRFGIRSITYRFNSSFIQITALSLGITALLLLTIVRSDLLQEWVDRLPAEAPNRFLINIQPSQLGSLDNYFRNNGFSVPDFHPMVRGRLVKINNKKVGSGDYDDDHAKRLIDREFNLSWAAEMQVDNTIVDGSWWTDQQHGQTILSVEEELASRLGINLGDELTFQIGDEFFVAEVGSLRKVQWDSFRPNFFVLTPPGVLDSYPATYISSVYVPESRFEFLNYLVRDFSNITVLDISAIMKHIRYLIDRVVDAVEYVFLFTLITGLLVMYATLYASVEERLYEHALLRTLGASRKQMAVSLATEFGSIGLLAGFFAAVSANLIGMILARYVFQMEVVWNTSLLFTGAIGGMICISFIGYYVSRFILSYPPITLLRQGV